MPTLTALHWLEMMPSPRPAIVNGAVQTLCLANATQERGKKRLGFYPRCTPTAPPTLAVAGADLAQLCICPLLSCGDSVSGSCPSCG